MTKARSVAARFTTEVAPLQVVSTTMRRRTAPVRRLEPIPEDDREQLAYWSDHHQLQQADAAAAATANSSGGFAASWSKRSPPAQASTGGGSTRDLCRASSRKGHRRVV